MDASGTVLGCSRRLLLAGLAAPLLQGCASPLRPLLAQASTPDAQALLAASAAAHGAAAFARIRDINVRYAGMFRGLIGTLQPDLVDASFRGGSEERLLLPDHLSAQSYTGPAGHKQVLRRTASGSAGDVQVWFNGVEAHDRERRDAAALVADDYALFLLGPMLLAGACGTERALVAELSDPERITVGGREYACDVLRARITPGLGFSASDDLALLIDREERLMRRVRITVNGLESTQGALAEVDCWDHVPLHGVRWPTRFHEHLLRPLLLPVHDWHLEGLDVDRGLNPADLLGPDLAGKAAAPATPLATAA